MKRAIASLVGITCCTGTIYAAESLPVTEGSARASTWSLAGESPTKAFLSSAQPGLSAASPAPMVQPLSTSVASGDGVDFGRLALKISYVGSILLTADQIVRSVDSVLDRMQLNREDGTQLKLLMEPGSRGVDVMLKMSRPFDF